MKKLTIIFLGITEKRADSLNNNPMETYTPDLDYDKGKEKPLC